MNKLRRFLALTAGLALCTLICMVGYVLVGQTAPAAQQRQERGIQANTGEWIGITARASFHGNSAYNGIGGSLRVDDRDVLSEFDIAMNGTDVDVFLTDMPTIDVTITPGSHYRVRELRVVRLDTDAAIPLPSFTYPRYGALSIQEIALTNRVDHRIEIVFDFRMYDVDIDHRWYGGGVINVSEFTALGGTLMTGSDAQVRLNSTLTLSHANQTQNNVRFTHAEMIYTWGDTEVLGVTRTLNHTFTAGDLGNFAHSGTTIRIVAYYHRTHRVDIEMPAHIGVKSIEILATSDVIVRGYENLADKVFDGTRAPVDDVEYTFVWISAEGVFRAILDQGTRFMIQGNDFELYRYTGFAIVAGNSGMLDNLNGQLTLRFAWAIETYTIVIGGQLPNLDPVTFAPGIVSVNVTNPVGGPIGARPVQFGDILVGVSVDVAAMLASMPHVELASTNQFWINRRVGMPDPFTAPMTIDEPFRGDYVTQNSDGTFSIIITIHLVNRHWVAINRDKTWYQVDVVAVNEGVVTSVLEENIDVEGRFFSTGTFLRITAFHQSFSTFQRFDPNSLITGTGGETQVGMSVVIQIRQNNRVINLVYQMREFRLVVNGEELTPIRVDRDDIIMTYEIPANHRIRSWVVNGQDMTEQVTGNRLTIRLSQGLLEANPTWIATGIVTINYEVDPALRIEILLAYVLPASIIPLLLIILISVMAVNSKRKKVIKAKLTEKHAEMVKRDIGGFITDVREGKSIGVTDEDIKRAMKEDKKK
jgi:hypothetical protein